MSALRLANANGRASLVRGDRLVDLEGRSDGKFSADVGSARQRYLAPGEEIRSHIESIGTLVNGCEKA